MTTQLKYINISLTFVSPVLMTSYFVLQARIAFLQGERKGQENLKNDLVRRIKMLEYALKQERYVAFFFSNIAYFVCVCVCVCILCTFEF